MNLKEHLNLSNENYGLLFDVRRSIRYHEYRRNFYQRLHKITNSLTLIMAGSVILDFAKSGNTPYWWLWLGVIAALFAATDLIIGYASKSNLHSQLRERFALLEIDMITGSSDDLKLWEDYHRQRLLIEMDEPSVYLALDLLCRNEVLIAQGFSKQKSPNLFFDANFWHRLTRNFLRWENITTA